MWCPLQPAGVCGLQSSPQSGLWATLPHGRKKRVCVGSMWGLGALYPRFFFLLLIRLSRMGVDGGGMLTKTQWGRGPAPAPLKGREQEELCRVLNNGARTVGSHPRDEEGPV